MKNLVILCGGLSSRMGSDKAALKIGEQTFVEYLYRKGLEYFDRIILSIDTTGHAEQIKNLPLFRELSDGSDGSLPELVIDNYDKAGPIGGLLSVFENTDVERFAVIATDVPNADMRVLSALHEICRKGVCKLIMPGCHPESLIAAYDRVVYDSVREFYENGGRKLRLAITAKYSELVSEDELKCFDPELRNLDFKQAFRNYNTREELTDLYD